MCVVDPALMRAEVTPPPPRASWNRDQRLAEVGANLRLRIECHKRDWAPWIAVGELNISGNDVSADIT